MFALCANFLTMKKSDFNYFLPEHLIAQQPLAERAASRLLCLGRDTGVVSDRHFGDLISLVNPDDLLVFNNTKVIPARLYGHKSSGGKVEILIERLLAENTALAHVRASKAPKPNTVIVLEQGYHCEVVGRVQDLFQLRFNTQGTVLAMLDKIGHIPLPPYITRADDAGDAQRYQTVFAEQAGAVAAPTAGLHFSEATMAGLKDKGVAFAFVTLHVGSGTFQPVRVENLAEHPMHEEYFCVPDATVAAVSAARMRGGRVVAIGTTAVRALESASVSGELVASSGDTRLFITPGYQFKSVDAMVTNFHLPESTLLMLVSAFAGYPAIMAAYQHAITQNYRFFSYGDAMFIG